MLKKEERGKNEAEVQHLGFIFSCLECHISSVLPMPRLPNAHNRAIWGNLVYVPSGNPNLLRHILWSDDNWGRNHRRRSHHNWCWRDCPGDNTTQDSTNESRPEIATASSPDTVVHGWWWWPMPPTKPAMWSAMWSCERGADAHQYGNRNCHFLGHFSTSIQFVLFVVTIFLAHSDSESQCPCPVEEPLGLNPDLMYGVNLL